MPLVWMVAAAVAVVLTSASLAAGWPVSCWDNFSAQTALTGSDSCTNLFHRNLPTAGHPYDVYAMMAALKSRALITSGALGSVSLTLVLVATATHRALGSPGGGNRKRGPVVTS